MRLLNYTSSVPATRSIAEIQHRLAAHGAEEITVRYAEREPAGLNFTLGTRFGLQTYRLPANVDAVEAILLETPRATKTRAQAMRTAWRNIKDWVEAQLAMVEAGQVAMDQVMLPYLELPGGSTMYEAYIEQGQKLLGSGR